MKNKKYLLIGLLTALLLLAALNACSPRFSTKNAGSLYTRVCVVRPMEESETVQAALKILHDLYPDAPSFSVADFPEAEHLCLSEKRTMILLDTERFPMQRWKPLEHFLQMGGRVLFWGRRPFAARIRAEGGKETGWEEIQQRQMEQAVTTGFFSAIQLWGPRSGANENNAMVRIARNHLLPWSGVDVFMDDFKGFNMLMSPELSTDHQIPGQINALGFYAWGDEKTTRLSLLCVDVDGEKWGTEVLLTGSWKPYVVSLAIFQRLSAIGSDESPILTVDRVRKIYVGLNNAIAPQLPGKHVFGVSNIKGVAGTPLEKALFAPRIPMLSPSYMHYTTTADFLQYMRTDQQVRCDEFDYESPLPLRLAVSKDLKTAFRSIPVCLGIERDKQEISGWGATLFVVPFPQGGIGVWGWIGTDATRKKSAWAKKELRSCVNRLQQGVFIVDVPAPRIMIAPNELIPVKIRWIAPVVQSGKIRIVAELLTLDGRRLRRTTVPMLRGAALNRDIHTTTINLGRAPDLKTETRNYTVRIALENISDETEQYDETAYDIKVTGEEKGLDVSWLRCVGSRFLSERQAVYLMGINYNPLNNLLLPEKNRASWLDPAHFSVERIRKDLTLLKGLKVNVVKIFYENSEQAPALRFFINEAARNGIRVGIEMDVLSPFSYDLEKAETMIRAIGLSEQPNVFAVFFGQKIHMNTAAERSLLDPAWRDWLITQYGNLQRAEKFMGKPDWKRNGLLSGPSNTELTSNGPHVVAVAVYRRFVEDYLSRRYGYLTRFVRSLGCRQLCSSSSLSLKECETTPQDILAGAIHFDFIAPSAEDFSGSSDDVLKLGFVSAFCRGGRGVIKPVVWINFGVSVGKNPRTADFENQEMLYDSMFEMINQSACAGSFARCYSSARGHLTKDYGVVNPSGTKRPVSMTFQRHARRLRNTMVYPSPWRGRTFTRSADARGVNGVLEKWEAIYQTEMAKGNCVEIRPFGFGKNTESMPLLTVGGVPFSGPAPLECANAEWGQIWVNGHPVLRTPDEALHVQWGDKVRAELINTGVATWSTSREDQKGTVWLEAHSPDNRKERFPLSVVPPGNHESMEWSATETGIWRFRPSIVSLGEFGEELKIEVGGKHRY